MPTVANWNTEYACWEADAAERGITDCCWDAGSSARAAVRRRPFVAAFRGLTISGNLLKMCKTRDCVNPRHFRLKTDPPDLTISPDMTHREDGCLIWDGALVANMPFLRFSGKNVNVAHIVAERDLPDFREVAAALVGQRRNGFPASPIVTKMCGKRLCINSEHFVISSEVIGGINGVNRLKREVGRGWAFWDEYANRADGITRASVNRLYRFWGLPGFQQFDSC